MTKSSTSRKQWNGTQCVGNQNTSININVMWTWDLRITAPVLYHVYQLRYLTLMLAVCLFCQYLCSWVTVRCIQPYWHTARNRIQIYDTTIEQALRKQQDKDQSRGCNLLYVFRHPSFSVHKTTEVYNFDSNLYPTACSFSVIFHGAAKYI